MDKATFRDLLAKGQIQRKRPEPGKVDWSKVLKKALKDAGVYTTRQFWEKFVKGKVNKGRTKNKLHEWCDEDKVCARIWDKDMGTYIWIFDQELVKLYHEQLAKQAS